MLVGAILLQISITVMTWAIVALAILSGGVMGVALLRARRIRTTGDLETKLPAPGAVPIDRIKLPVDAARYFDSFTLHLEELGFACVDDYRLTEADPPVYSRIFAGDIGQTFAEITVAKTTAHEFVQRGDVKCLAFLTVFQNGTCVQTVNLPADPSLSQAPQLITSFRPKLRPCDLLTEHESLCAQYAVDHHSRPVVYPPEQLAEVSAYYAQYPRHSKTRARRAAAPSARRHTPGAKQPTSPTATETLRV